MTEGDISRIEKIIHLCDDCKFATCEQCEINYGDVYAIKHLYEENKKLQKEIEEYKRYDYRQFKCMDIELLKGEIKP